VRPRSTRRSWRGWRSDQAAAIEFPGSRRRRAARRACRGSPWEADRQTHELLVEVTPARLERRIAIGQRADVRIELARQADAVRVPTRLIHHDRKPGRSSTSIAVVKIAVVRPRLGVTGRDHVEVLEGLAEGDVVLGALDRGRACSRSGGAGGPVNLAVRDVRRHLGRFGGTAAGSGCC
jgi:hypothetical protein